jgi:hypothetical protein
MQSQYAIGSSPGIGKLRAVRCAANTMAQCAITGFAIRKIGTSHRDIMTCGVVMTIKIAGMARCAGIWS